MGTYGGEPGASQGGNNNAAARARIALYEALTELRRLTRDPLVDGLNKRSPTSAMPQLSLVLA